MKLSNGVKRLFWAWLAVLAILVAMLTTGCATTDYRILHTKGVPLCRHRTQAWLEKRQALGFEVARVYCVNRAFPVRSPGHVIGAARRPGAANWTFVDTNTGEDVDWTIWRMVRMDLDISKPCPPWFRVDGKPMVFMTDTNRKGQGNTMSDTRPQPRHTTYGSDMLELIRLLKEEEIDQEQYNENMAKLNDKMWAEYDENERRKT